MQTNLKSGSRTQPIPYPGRALSLSAAPAWIPGPFPQSSPRAPQLALCNTQGFWMLTFKGESTVLGQDQSLFYLAWLLDHPFTRPISGQDLAAKVESLFCDHPDFRQIHVLDHAPAQ